MQITSSPHSMVNTNYVRSKENPFSARANEADSQNSERDSARVQPDTTDKASEATSPTQEVSGLKPSSLEAKQKKIEELEGHKDRITYGLKVLELMSDEEYRAFLWASEGMSDSEKMLMAQSLYRFTDFYQGRGDKHRGDMNLDLQNTHAHRAFGVEQRNIDDFINRYKNAYDKVLESQHFM